MRAYQFFVCASFVASLVGCADASDEMSFDDGMVDEVEQELEVENALNPNALNPNALNPNALNPNALASIQLADEAGDMSRLLLKYAISCAFSTSQSFNFSWTDSSGAVRNESYRGLLGLATSWATGPLDAQGQAMVSACLASRTNYYGITVTISSRSSVEPLYSNTYQGELNQYSNIEGAFWGNIFAAQPHLNACYRGSMVDYSRSKLRECAAGHLNDDGSISGCGMIQIVGPCSQFCGSFNSTHQYYPWCHSGSASSGTVNVITVGLR